MIKSIIIYICILISTYIFYMLFIGYLSFYILILTCLIPFLSLILLLYNKKYSKVYFTNNNIECIQDKSVILKITRETPLMGSCKIKILDKEIILNNNTKTIEYQYPHCGGYQIKIEEYKQYDSLNLFYLTNKTNSLLNITILPKMINYDINHLKNTLPDQNNTVYSSTQKGDDPTEIYDIHEYQEGDLLKNIHWKLSMKHDKLLIKENALPLKQSISIQCHFYNNDEDNDSVFQYLDFFCNYLLDNDLPFLLCNQYITDEQHYKTVLQSLLWNKKDIHNHIKSTYSYIINKDGIYAL